MNSDAVKDVSRQPLFGHRDRHSLQVSHSPTAKSSAVHTKHFSSFSPHSGLYVHGECAEGTHPQPLGTAVRPTSEPHMKPVPEYDGKKLFCMAHSASSPKPSSPNPLIQSWRPLLKWFEMLVEPKLFVKIEKDISIRVYLLLTTWVMTSIAKSTVAIDAHKGRGCLTSCI